jgi:hypothetical protein
MAAQIKKNIAKSLQNTVHRGGAAGGSGGGATHGEARLKGAGEARLAGVGVGPQGGRRNWWERGLAQGDVRLA